MDNVRTITIEPHKTRSGYYCLLIIYRGDNADPIHAAHEKTKTYNDPRQAYADAVSRQVELMVVSRG